MSRELKNLFSWSPTRDAVFQTCLRQYYFNHYGFWGGWREDTSARTRQIYVLKQLQTRQMWAGEKVHDCIQRSIANLRRGVALLDSEEAVDITLKTMRAEFRFSRSKGYWKMPKQCALFEHEYDVEVSDAEWKGTAERVQTCLRAFYGSDLWEELKALPSKDWLEVEEFSHFSLDGVTVYVKLDCCFRRKDRISVLDWKTGKGRRDAHAIQMVCYALYACERWGVAPDQVQSSEVRLPSLERIDHRITEREIENVKAYARGSISDMLSLLKDRQENVPLDEGAFSVCEEEKSCEACNFRKVCPKW